MNLLGSAAFLDGPAPSGPRLAFTLTRYSKPPRRRPARTEPGPPRRPPFRKFILT